MTIEYKCKWEVYPEKWPLIGKYRQTKYLTINTITEKNKKHFKRWGYEYDYYEGFTFNTLSFYFFFISWGLGYETHKDNKANDQWKNK